MSKSANTPSFHEHLAKSASYAHCIGVSGLDINNDSENLLSLLYRWNFFTHTFSTGCQEISPSLEDVYEILRLPSFGDGEVANIFVS